jgi:hypothetical protein
MESENEYTDNDDDVEDDDHDDDGDYVSEITTASLHRVGVDASHNKVSLV